MSFYICPGRLLICFAFASALAASTVIPAHGATLFFSENFDATTVNSNLSVPTGWTFGTDSTPNGVAHNNASQDDPDSESFFYSPNLQCLAIDVSRKLTSEDVLERLSDLFVRKGVPDHVRSDNDSELTAKRVREWLARVGVKTLSIEPGSPWENGYVESFNGKLRDALLDREVFNNLLEAKVLIERWRKACNTVRPHSSLGYRPPARESRTTRSAGFGYACAS